MSANLNFLLHTHKKGGLVSDDETEKYLYEFCFFPVARKNIYLKSDINTQSKIISAYSKMIGLMDR